MGTRNLPEPTHVSGTSKGEEQVKHHGREPGRDDSGKGDYRTARDSTGINAEARAPIDPKMPNLPPA
jgi:hypothetical protein